MVPATMVCLPRGLAAMETGYFLSVTAVMSAAIIWAARVTTGASDALTQMVTSVWGADRGNVLTSFCGHILICATATVVRVRVRVVRICRLSKRNFCIFFYF